MKRILTRFMIGNVLSTVVVIALLSGLVAGRVYYAAPMSVTTPSPVPTENQKSKATIAGVDPEPVQASVEVPAQSQSAPATTSQAPKNTKTPTTTSSPKNTGSTASGYSGPVVAEHPFTVTSISLSFSYTCGAEGTSEAIPSMKSNVLKTPHPGGTVRWRFEYANVKEGAYGGAHGEHSTTYAKNAPYVYFTDNQMPGYGRIYGDIAGVRVRLVMISPQQVSSPWVTAVPNCP